MIFFSSSPTTMIDETLIPLLNNFSASHLELVSDLKPLTSSSPIAMIADFKLIIYIKPFNAKVNIKIKVSTPDKISSNKIARFDSLI